MDYIWEQGGKDENAAVNNMLKFCLVDKIARKYSYMGKTKKSFKSLALSDCIYGK